MPRTPEFLIDYHSSTLMFEDIDQLLQSRHQISQSDSQDIFAKTRDFQKVVRLSQEAGIYPYFQPLELNEGTEAILRGKRVIMLGSNNYLGLTTDPRVREAAIDAIRKFGPSMTGSRLLNGTLELHETFEREIAEFLNKESALVFTTGYQANIGIISALANPQTTVYLDKLDHACLFDAVKLSGANLSAFRHNNIEDLERALAETPLGEGRLIAVDGVFSMEGDITPLPEIVRLCQKYKARLLVDDAHALGVLGENGRGTASHFGLERETDLIMATFSKSLASTGGYVAGDQEVVEYIKHFGRSMIFSASLPPPNLAAARTALQILKQEPERVRQVNQNAKKLKEGLLELGWEVGPTQTPIIPVRIGNDLTALLIWKELLEEGVYVNPVIYPAVEKDKAGLRISTIATHTKAHLDQALEIFQRVGERYHLNSSPTLEAYR